MGTLSGARKEGGYPHDTGMEDADSRTLQKRSVSTHDEAVRSPCTPPEAFEPKAFSMESWLRGLDARGIMMRYLDIVMKEFGGPAELAATFLPGDGKGSV